MDEFKIKQYAPELAKNNPNKVKEVKKYLKEVTGIPDECSLKDVKVKYLTKDGLLKLGSSTKLVEAWQKDQSRSFFHFNFSELYFIITCQFKRKNIIVSH